MTKTKREVNVIFIRHGATESNLEKKYCGAASDEDLCPEGKIALEEKKEKGIYPAVDFLFCGKKKRCISTARIIYPDTEYKIVDAFDEIDFGDFEGKNYDRLKNQPAYVKWLENGGKAPFPNGESREEYCKKMWNGFLEILDEIDETAAGEKEQENKPETTPVNMGIVVHGGTIMAILSKITGGEYFDFQTGCGCGFFCRIYETETGFGGEVTALD